MKKIICILLCLLLLCPSLAGCANDEPGLTIVQTGTDTKVSFKAGGYQLQYGTYRGYSVEYTVDDNGNTVEAGRNEIVVTFRPDNTYQLSDESHKFTVIGKELVVPDLNNAVMFQAIDNDKVLLMIGAGVELSLAGEKPISSAPTSAVKEGSVRVTDNATKNIRYSTFDDGWMSIQVPEGWVVKVLPTSDITFYTFMVENPNEPDMRIFFNMQCSGFLSSEQERSWYANLYPGTPFAIAPAINPQTTEAYYRVFTEAWSPNNTGSFIIPTMNDFTTVESLGTGPLGGEILRGHYTNENGKTVDGIFSAHIMPVPLYYVTALTVYSSMFYTAPEGMLTEWEPVLNTCFSTFTFSEAYINAYYKQEQAIAQTSAALAQMASETSDIITRGWESRQSTYDIISQKRSDATMGYERVYDTTTGEIYKASVGFTDYDWNGKYQSVTDDMYNLPTSGYIEKVD